MSPHLSIYNSFRRMIAIGAITVLVLVNAGCRNSAVALNNASNGTALLGFAAPIENFAVVSPDVWRGARPREEGYQWLASAGVKTIIDLQESDLSAQIPTGVTYLPIRTSAWRVTNMDTQRVLAAIEGCEKPVYIHCEQGRDRTGLAIATYQLSQGRLAQDAIDELDVHQVNFWWRDSIRKRIEELAAQRPTTMTP